MGIDARALVPRMSLREVALRRVHSRCVRGRAHNRAVGEHLMRRTRGVRAHQPVHLRRLFPHLLPHLNARGFRLRKRPGIVLRPVTLGAPGMRVRRALEGAARRLALLGPQAVPAAARIDAELPRLKHLRTRLRIFLDVEFRIVDGVVFPGTVLFGSCRMRPLLRSLLRWVCRSLHGWWRSWRDDLLRCRRFRGRAVPVRRRGCGTHRLRCRRRRPVLRRSYGRCQVPVCSSLVRGGRALFRSLRPRWRRGRNRGLRTVTRHPQLRVRLLHEIRILRARRRMRALRPFRMLRNLRDKLLGAVCRLRNRCTTGRLRSNAVRCLRHSSHVGGNVRTP